MPDPINALIQAIGVESRRQHKSGNHSKAAGLSLIAFGIFTLPVPIIGIPLILMGIWKLCT
jgi:hypothetical protein